MMLNKTIDRLGDSNPQIFRELKERITPRNVGIAVVGALLIQGLVLLYFNGQIPVPTYEGIPAVKLMETRSPYCLFPPNTNYNYDDSICRLNTLGGYAINWQKWWTDVYICLAWILPLGLILGSVYTLVADVIQEEKRGTLNFIRLSPQSAQTIFIGKILGVPSLVYLAIALVLPLHLWAGINAGGSIPFLASWYLAIGSLSFLLASAAVLYVLLGGIQAILTVIATGYPICLPLLGINSFAAGTLNNEGWMKNLQVSWFGLPYSSSAIWFYVFGTGCCLLASYWVWQALERRYLNPTATIISKSQSYLLNLCWQIWLAGFTIPLLMSGSKDTLLGTAIGFGIIDFIGLLLLIPLLLTSKQAIQDWSRYRRERVTHQPRKFWQRELVQDLIFNDKSPALLAIAINIGIALVLWIPVSFRIALINPSYGVRFLAGVCLATSLILIYAAIAHLGLFLKVRKRNLWIIAGLLVAMFLPAVGAYALSPDRTPTGLSAILLLFSPFAPLGIINLAGGSILATFAAQLGMFALLTRQLQRRLQISGQSQSKELTANSSV
jgi:hypothetical protein